MDGWVLRSGVGWVDIYVGGQTDRCKRQVDVSNGRAVAKIETNIWERDFGMNRWMC
jgi:hypothetical protein